MESIFAKISSECFDTRAFTHPAVGDTMSMTDSVQFTSSLGASIQCSLGVYRAKILTRGGSELRTFDALGRETKGSIWIRRH